MVYDEPLPLAFREDFRTTTHRVVWIGQNLWQVAVDPEQNFHSRYGYEFLFLAQNEGQGPDTTFFQTVHYKGEELVKYFHENGTYVVLLADADPQAYRTDRFEGWLRQPAEIGPVLFSNSSPTYANLRAVEGGGSGDGGMSTAVLLALIVGGVVAVGGAAFALARSRGGADDRE